MQVDSSLQLVAVLRDSSGRPVSGRSVTWSTADPAVATVSDDGLVTGVAPGATTITASGGGSSGTATITVAPGPPRRLDFAVQPVATAAGEAIAPDIVVTARDSRGHTATGFGGNVTVAIGTNPAGGTLAGVTTVTATRGVATFSGVSIDRSGVGYTLQATGDSLAGATSATFDITPGPATRLAFTTQPTTAGAGHPITPAVSATALDRHGNTATAFTARVTISLGGDPGGATLLGTTTADAVAGVATFANLSLNRAGTGFTLVVSSATLPGETSAPFDVIAVTAERLVFSTEPSLAPAGGVITPAVVVLALDSLGNVATSFAGPVTVGLDANPGGASLSGATTVTAAAGAATFADLSLDKAGEGYTLVATSAVVAPDTSAAFDVAAGPAARLVFSTHPDGISAGSPIAPAIVVTAQDPFGNTATSFGGDVTVAVGVNPGGAALLGTTTVAAAAGVARFTDLTLGQVGSGYTLVATAGSLTPATSATFDVTAAAPAHLGFATQPTTTTAGDPITVVVDVRDTLGNPVTTFDGVVTIVLGSNPGGATLSGTAAAAAVGGVATFTDLRVDRAGAGYTLVATAPALTGAISMSFTVTAAAAARLAFTVHPRPTVAGESITPAVEVTARDPFGNRATSFYGDVTVALETNPGGATLSGSRTVAAVAGVATFTDLSIDKMGSGYTLGASAASLTGAVSGGFDVASAAAAELTFSVQPATAIAGEVLAPAVTVTALDRFGNTVTGFTGEVAVALGTNAGAATLTGRTAVAAVSGVARFADLRIDRTGDYTLVATAPGLPAATSTWFGVVPGPATRLVFTAQPTLTQAGSPIAPAVVATAQDSLGNTAPSFAGTITVVLDANPGNATLSGTTVVAAVGGVATFSNLRLDRTASGFTLRATASGLTAATSAAFDVVPGIAQRLVFTAHPTNTTAGGAVAPAVVVTAQDSFGNTATPFTASVTMSLGANAGGATLSGTNPVTAVDGVATFSNLRLDRAGSGYTLVATAAALTSATSQSFNVAAGSAALLAFTVGPGTTVAGAALTPAVQVTARDDYGNTAASFTGNVTVAIGTNPGGSTLGGTSTVAAVAGVATFADLTLNKVGAGYTLTASAATLAGPSSAGFTITAATAKTLAFTVQPVSAVVGTAITPAVQVTARDNYGNTAAAFSGNVTVALANNPNGATLSGTKTVAAVAGVATFSTLSLNKTGTGYTLRATASGLSNATSTAFNVTATGGTVVFVGAGDIADCGADAAATAALLDNIPGTVFTAGDNAYPDGSADDYARCYEPTWGRHKARTRPSPGNHDYQTSGAAAYFSYFGANAGPSGRGYYSYNIGDWHIVSLNSNVSMATGSAQEQWLRADLAASSKRCTLAYWHHPRFSSGDHGSSTAAQPLWQALYDAGAEVVVAGHDHNYQRFAPMTATGTLDLARGIRQFVAGTGGASHYGFSSPIANTEAYDTSTSGVLKLTLSASSYTWEFVPVAGGTYRDSGSGTCH